MSDSLATFGGGCFWCTEAVFLQLRGVKSVVSGYAGGKTSDPTYESICTGSTGHAECVQITFDSEEISFRALLEVFFHSHDPTTENRQGADIGTQYRSVIFYHDDDQRMESEQLCKELHDSGEFGGQIVTEISSITKFYPAETYHQDYFSRNRAQPYCSYTIGPKVAKVMEKFANRLR